MYIYEYDEEVDFLQAWEMMLEKYDIQENEWLPKLFAEREKLALVYGRDIFYVDMKSTQRSEGMNNVLRQYLQKSFPSRFFQAF